MLLLSIFRLWVRRIVWLVVGICVTVLAAYIPVGFRGYTTTRFPPASEGVVFRSVAEPQRIEPRTAYHANSLNSWSIERYWSQLRWYFMRLHEGRMRLVLTNPNGVGESKLVFEVIRATAWSSFQILLSTILIGCLLGTVGGLLAAMYRSVRAVLLPLSVASVGVPDFLLIYIGWILSIWSFSKFGYRPFDIFITQSTPFTLPFIVLCIFNTSYMIRVTLGVAQELEHEDYIRTARSKGLTEWRVWTGHVMRNAIPRILNALPMLMNVTMSSLILMEVLYRRPGLGFHLSQIRDVEMAASIGTFLVVWVIFVDGLAQTIRVAVNPLLREVGE